VAEPPSSEDDDATEFVEHEDAVEDDGASQQQRPPPALRQRSAPAPESDGRSSLMPSSLQAANKMAVSARVVGSVLGEAAAAAATHEISMAARAPTGSSQTSLSPSAQSKAQQAFVHKHKNSVLAGAQVGQKLGAAAGQGLGALFVALTKRLGAHKCDNCHKPGMYDYMKCTSAGCAKDRVRLPAAAGMITEHLPMGLGEKLHLDELTVLQEGFDLCFDCHANFLKGSKAHPSVRVQHDPAHVFRKHVNGVSAFKLLVLVVWCLIAVRWFFNRIF
jgi:hypothetical protein